MKKAGYILDRECNWMARRTPVSVFGCLRSDIAFTLTELLVVISIIGVLASLIVGLAGAAGRKGKEARVRAELRQLVTAIESYKAEIGYYPPASTNNPAVNPLFYELSGTYSTDGVNYQTVNRSERITQSVIQSIFKLDGFQNSKRDPKEARAFMNFKANQYKEIRSVPDVELLVVPIDWPVNVVNPALDGASIPAKQRINPWRYVPVEPTNNPTGFDLWAEIPDRGKMKVIGNW